MPRRWLVDLTDCQEELITLGDLTDERIKSMSAHSSDEALPHRLFLVVEELDPLTRRFTSDFGHTICRFVAVADYAIYLSIFICLKVDVGPQQRRSASTPFIFIL